MATAEGKISGTSSETSEETYDPFWTHAYSFLRDPEDNFSVPLDNARMGSLVKFDGLVQLFDMKIMRNLWEPSMRAALLSQVAVMPDDARQQSSRKQRREPDYLTISSDALVMEFGAVVDGVWTVVGIVDGRIGDTPEPVKTNPMLDGVLAAMASIREVIGRPKDHFGLTPIAIYAHLRGAVETEAEAQASSPMPTED